MPINTLGWLGSLFGSKAGQMGLSALAAWLFGGKDVAEMNEAQRDFINQMMRMAEEDMGETRRRRSMLRPAQELAIGRTTSALERMPYVSPMKWLEYTKGGSGRTGYTLPLGEDYERAGAPEPFKVPESKYPFRYGTEAPFLGEPTEQDEPSKELTEEEIDEFLANNPWEQRYEQLLDEYAGEFPGNESEYWDWVIEVNEQGFTDELKDSPYYSETLSESATPGRYELTINPGDPTDRTWKVRQRTVTKKDGITTQVGGGYGKRGFQKRGVITTTYNSKTGIGNRSIEYEGEITSPGAEYTYGTTRTPEDIKYLMDELFKKGAKSDVMGLAQRRGRMAGLPQPKTETGEPVYPEMPLDIAMKRLKGRKPLQPGAMYRYGAKNLPSNMPPRLPPRRGGF